MSLNDLDRILKKDPIISTWPAGALRDSPAKVEKDYATHAKTHLSLGDTADYLDKVFKWVGGVNKGALVGAVLGDYGQGKTSFLVHMWDQSRERGILTVPPFEWDAFEDILQGIADWVAYVLGDRDALLQKEALDLLQEFQTRSIEDLAKQLAFEAGMDYEEALKAAQTMIASDRWRRNELSASEVLDFVVEMTTIVKEGGYAGLLVLLDEPEIAAKVLGTEAVSHFFFQLADEISHRNGDYGFFLSLPQQFYATAAARFSSLPPRLSIRHCFVRLGDLYGPGFGADLWQRYMQAFDLVDKSRDIIDPLTLTALGQIGASARAQLSYGPRTVVSAFNQIVADYRREGRTATVESLVDWMLGGDIYVQDEYVSRIQDALRSPDVDDTSVDAVRVLAAFPLGLRFEAAEELGIKDALTPLARPGSLVRRTANTYRLRSLDGGGTEDESVLLQHLQGFDAEFVPSLPAFEYAIAGFVEKVLPKLFAPRKGQQLVGWSGLSRFGRVGSRAWFGTLEGAFAQTEREFPMRRVMVAISSVDQKLQEISAKPPTIDDGGTQQYDLLFHLKLRWSANQPLPPERVQILRGDPEQKKVSQLSVSLDLTDCHLRHEYLAEQFGQERITPLWALYVLKRMSLLSLPKEAEGEWRAVSEQLQRQLPTLLFGATLADMARDQVAGVLQREVAGQPTGANLIGAVALQMLRDRYPGYATLIVAPHWKDKITSYLGALQNSAVPLGCKRGNRPWKADTNATQTAFGTSRMNLTGGFFDRLESLIEIKGSGRTAPLDVIFRLHPLEKAIIGFVSDMATEEGRLMKVDGKSCPFFYESELAPQLLAMGYTRDEVGLIVEMGQARQSFERASYRGEDVLCCKTVDVEMLRTRCKAELEAVFDEIGRCKKVPGYHPPNLDLDRTKEQIKQIEDDADAEEVLLRLGDISRGNRRFIQGSYGKLVQCLQGCVKALNDYGSQLAQSPKVKRLTPMPTGVSAWCATLVKYIRANIKKNAQTLVKKIKAQQSNAGGLVSRYGSAAKATHEQTLEDLIEGWQSSGLLSTAVADIQQDLESLNAELDHYGQWLRLLNVSDGLYKELVEQSQDRDTSSKGSEMISQFEEISGAISEHLQLRNLSGLANYGQFVEQLKELNESLQAYREGMKSEFQLRKDAVNALLTDTHLDARVKTTLDYLNPAASYETLFSEGSRAFQEGADQLQEDLAQQERELAYTADVLGMVPNDVRTESLTRLEQSRESLSRASEVCTHEWLRNAVERGDTEALKSVLGPAQEALQSVDEVRHQVGRYRKPRPPEGKSDRKTYELVPEQGDVDLQQIVLSLMEQGEAPSQAVDSALKALGELFRRSCVHIDVRRRTH